MAAISNEQRLSLELDVVKKVIQDAIQQGYYCRVYDGEEWATTHTQNETTLVDALRSTDQDYVYFYKVENKPEKASRWPAYGFVHFVYGNMPYEVIADNTDTDEINAIVKGGEALQDAIEADIS